MRITPLDFREFDDGQQTITRPAGKPFLPGGRYQGEGPPPPPVFSGEQVKEAEREAYKKGFLEGTEEGRKQQAGEQDEVKRKLSEALVGFAQKVTPVFEDYRRMATRIQEDVPKIALAIARKVAGDALNENASASVEEIARRCITAMIAEPKLTVTVHESLGDVMDQRLKELAGKLQAASDIVVVRDANIPVTDCRVEWAQGAFARNTEKLWQDIEAAIGGMAAAAAHDAGEQMQQVETELNKPQEPLEINETAEAAEPEGKTEEPTPSAPEPEPPSPKE